MSASADMRVHMFLDRWARCLLLGGMLVLLNSLSTVDVQMTYYASSDKYAAPTCTFHLAKLKNRVNSGCSLYSSYHMIFLAERPVKGTSCCHLWRSTSIGNSCGFHSLPLYRSSYCLRLSSRLTCSMRRYSLRFAMAASLHSITSCYKSLSVSLW